MSNIKKVRGKKTVLKWKYIGPACTQISIGGRVVLRHPELLTTEAITLLLQKHLQLKSYFTQIH